MKGKELLKEINDIDEKYIEEALKEYNGNHYLIRKGMALVACFAVIILTIGFLAKIPELNDLVAKNEIKNTKIEFGKIDEIDQFVESEKIHIEGHFWEILTEVQNAEFFPELINVFDIYTSAHYSKIEDDIKLVHIVSELITSDGESIEILISPNDLNALYYDKLLLTKVNEIDIYTGYYPHVHNNKISCIAKFQLGNMYYSITSYDASNTVGVEKVVTSLMKMNVLDLSVLNPIPPKRLVNESLTLEEAYKDKEFGKFVPQELPHGYIFQGIDRMVNQEYNLMSIYLTNGIRYFHWRISELREEEKQRITSVDITENYELKQYPLPWFDTVPEERREIIENPIFIIDELSLEVIERRCYKEGFEEELGGRMHFSVLYGNVLVEINAEGISSDVIYKMLLDVKNKLE